MNNFTHRITDLQICSSWKYINYSFFKFSVYKKPKNTRSRQPEKLSSEIICHTPRALIRSRRTTPSKLTLFFVLFFVAPPSFFIRFLFFSVFLFLLVIERSTSLSLLFKIRLNENSV